MIIQNINNPKVTQEISKEDWKKLGKSQKVFRILDEKDSDIVRQNVISNTIGKPATKTKAGEPDPKAPAKAVKK